MNKNIIPKNGFALVRGADGNMHSRTRKLNPVARRLRMALRKVGYGKPKFRTNINMGAEVRDIYAKRRDAQVKSAHELAQKKFREGDSDLKTKVTMAGDIGLVYVTSQVITKMLSDGKYYGELAEGKNRKVKSMVNYRSDPKGDLAKLRWALARPSARKRVENIQKIRQLNALERN